MCAARITESCLLLPAAVLLAVLAAVPAWPAPADRRQAEESAAAAPAWPAPPAEARIRFMLSVDGASDWGITRGWLSRIADSLTGRREMPFVRPTGVAERAGMLYVADPGAQCVVILDRNGRREVRVTRFGERELVSPVAVAPGPEGGVFVADSWLRQVLLFGRDGHFQRIAASEALLRPAGVAYDFDRQRLYVADSQAHAVFEFDAQGRPVRTIGRKGDAEGEFNSPTHIALDGRGGLLVTDALNFRVQAFDDAGQWRYRLGEAGDGAGNFAAPKGVAVDPEGHVFVADAMFDAVQVFDARGRLLLGFGRQGAGPGEFWMPNGVHIAEQGRLYVADAYNRRIQVFQLLGMQADPAGPGGSGAW